MTIQPGFHAMPSAAYHADPAPAPSLSSSIVQVILRESPRKAWFLHPKLNPNFREEHEDKFDLGTTAHAALLEGSAGVEVIDPANYPSKTGSIPDGWTNTAIRGARDAARANGKTPILKRHYDGVQAMVEAAQKFIASSEIAEEWNAPDAQSEVTAICQDGGVWLRARFDRFSRVRCFIGDYKSTESTVEPEAFSRFIARMGYHWQEAFYRRVAKRLGLEAQRFVFLAQSCQPPHECTLHGCHPAMQEIADADIDRAIGIWRDCLRANNWPSYGGRIHYAMPTAYMMSEHEMRMAA